MGNRVAAAMTRAGGHRVTRTVAATIGVAGPLFTRVASRTDLAHQRLRRRAARGALGSAPGAETDRGAARAARVSLRRHRTDDAMPDHCGNGISALARCNGDPRVDGDGGRPLSLDANVGLRLLSVGISRQFCRETHRRSGLLVRRPQIHNSGPRRERNAFARNGGWTARSGFLRTQSPLLSRAPNGREICLRFVASSTDTEHRRTQKLSSKICFQHRHVRHDCQSAMRPQQNARFAKRRTRARG